MLFCAVGFLPNKEAITYIDMFEQLKKRANELEIVLGMSILVGQL
jgi:hypothetical protein